MDFSLEQALAAAPPGRWAVGVSGGADSVALLMLLIRLRPDVRPFVVHLDHQTRGADSTGDAAFVSSLAKQLAVPCHVALRSDVEKTLGRLESNASARYRAARLALFEKIVSQQSLEGVLLAHHADDQAETVFLRLLRGSPPHALASMAFDARVGPLRICRPLLGVRSAALRQFLRDVGQPWREDASNASDRYLRNRLRQVLAAHPRLHDRFLALGEACRKLADWSTQSAPVLAEEFDAGRLAELPAVLADESARRWLRERGAPGGEIGLEAVSRLVAMAADAATPPRVHFPGRLLVSRRGGKIRAH